LPSCIVFPVICINKLHFNKVFSTPLNQIKATEECLMHTRFVYEIYFYTHVYDVPLTIANASRKWKAET
jgi:hypothetical protein